MKAASRVAALLQAGTVDSKSNAPHHTRAVNWISDGVRP
jgi:hypothetical protein